MSNGEEITPPVQPQVGLGDQLLDMAQRPQAAALGQPAPLPTQQLLGDQILDMAPLATPEREAFAQGRKDEIGEVENEQVVSDIVRRTLQNFSNDPEERVRILEAIGMRAELDKGGVIKIETPDGKKGVLDPAIGLFEKGGFSEFLKDAFVDNEKLMLEAATGTVMATKSLAQKGVSLMRGTLEAGGTGIGIESLAQILRPAALRRIGVPEEDPLLSPQLEEIPKAGAGAAAGELLVGGLLTGAASKTSKFLGGKGSSAVKGAKEKARGFVSRKMGRFKEVAGDLGLDDQDVSAAINLGFPAETYRLTAKGRTLGQNIKNIRASSNKESRERFAEIMSSGGKRSRAITAIAHVNHMSKQLKDFYQKNLGDRTLSGSEVMALPEMDELLKTSSSLDELAGVSRPAYKKVYDVVENTLLDSKEGKAIVQRLQALNDRVILDAKGRAPVKLSDEKIRQMALSELQIDAGQLLDLRRKLDSMVHYGLGKDAPANSDAVRNAFKTAADGFRNRLDRMVQEGVESGAIDPTEALNFTRINSDLSDWIPFRNMLDSVQANFLGSKRILTNIIPSPLLSKTRAALQLAERGYRSGAFGDAANVAGLTGEAKRRAGAVNKFFKNNENKLKALGAMGLGSRELVQFAAGHEFVNKNFATTDDPYGGPLSRDVDFIKRDPLAYSTQVMMMTGDSALSDTIRRAASRSNNFELFGALQAAAETYPDAFEESTYGSAFLTEEGMLRMSLADADRMQQDSKRNARAAVRAAIANELNKNASGESTEIEISKIEQVMPIPKKPKRVEKKSFSGGIEDLTGKDNANKIAASRAVTSLFAERQAKKKADRLTPAERLQEAGGLKGGGAVSEEGAKKIEKFEGFEPKAMRPIRGDRLTVGFGSTFLPKGTRLKDGTVIDKERAVQAGDELTRAEALRIKSGTDKKFAAAVSKRLGEANVSQKEFDSLTSLAQNAGPNNKRLKSAIANVKAGKAKEALKDILRVATSKGKFVGGLGLRRIEEAEDFVKGFNSRSEEKIKVDLKALKRNIDTKSERRKMTLSEWRKLIDKI